MADKCLVKLLQSLLQLVILSVYKRKTNYYTARFSNSKHFRFILAKNLFISE